MVGLDRVATAHTRDDQAETVLLRLMRGAGTRGLAGIYPRFLVSSPQFLEKTGPAAGPPPSSLRDSMTRGGPAVVRPLLEITRAELRTYLEQQNQPWREDATNRDVSYARNRLRHELMPLLTREYNPALAEVLSDLAEIARGEEEYWDCEVRQRMPKVSGRAVGERPATIFVERLLVEPAAMQRRLMRAFAEQHRLRLEFRHVEELLAMARAEGSAAEVRIELPQGWEAVRQESELWFRIRSEPAEQTTAYDFALPPGRQVEVAGRKIRAILVSGQVSSAGEAAGSASPTRVLLDAALAERSLRVRNWRPGDRYWPAHTKEPKKLKELLQARHIPRAYKTIWPVVVGGDDIVWVPGFAVPERFQVQPGNTEALLLEEVAGES
jgi:tRNA(Ile)-lysidine synthase